LEQIKPAMAPYSRILLKESVLPEKNISTACAILDLTMMTFGSLERTESQWRNIIKGASLKLVKIWPDLGGPHSTAIIEIALDQ